MAGSNPLSARCRGRVRKPSPSRGAKADMIREPSVARTMDFSKSTLFTQGVLTAISRGFWTLTPTSLWPTQSGSTTPDGGRGVASHD